MSAGSITNVGAACPKAGVKSAGPSDGGGIDKGVGATVIVVSDAGGATIAPVPRDEITCGSHAKGRVVDSERVEEDEEGGGVGCCKASPTPTPIPAPAESDTPEEVLSFVEAAIEVSTAVTSVSERPLPVGVAELTEGWGVVFI